MTGLDRRGLRTTKAFLGQYRDYLRWYDLAPRQVPRPAETPKVRISEYTLPRCLQGIWPS